MRGTLERDYVGIALMIPEFRARQPRDGPMQCGTQPADISVIHRRLKLLGVALSIRCAKIPHQHRKSSYAQDCEDDACHA